MKTNREGRALLGIAADYLSQAYGLVPDLTNMAGVQDQARELLDGTNAYAQAIYATVPDNDEPVDETMRPRIETALLSAQRGLRVVAEVRADLEISYLKEIADILPTGAAAIASAAAGAAADHWVLTACAAIGALIAWRLFLSPRAIA
jgi:hypothetical protein